MKLGVMIGYRSVHHAGRSPRRSSSTRNKFVLVHFQVDGCRVQPGRKKNPMQRYDTKHAR